MFTGIIEETGKVKAIRNNAKSSVITILADKVVSDTKLGDSIAVNGVCLTVVRITKSEFDADVMAETIRRSSLGKLQKGDFVNLERAMMAGGRFGGHIVSGHIDDTGVITSFVKEDNAVWVNIECDPELMKYIVFKGSVALDGISLTVAKVSENGFSVSVIPHTKEETTLLSKKVGDIINIECDVIGKYVENMMKFSQKETEKKKSKIDLGFLSENGFL